MKNLKEIIDGQTTGSAFWTIPTIRLVRRASTMRIMRMDKTVRDAMERIRLKACEGLMAQDVVKLFDCSRRMAEIRFRNATGTSIVEAIRETRLEKAKELLISGPRDLGTVSNLCGYATATSFANFFAAETGLSPTHWRKRQESPPIRR